MGSTQQHPKGGVGPPKRCHEKGPTASRKAAHVHTLYTHTARHDHSLRVSRQARARPRSGMAMSLSPPALRRRACTGLRSAFRTPGRLRRSRTYRVRKPGTEGACLRGAPALPE